MSMVVEVPDISSRCTRYRTMSVPGTSAIGTWYQSKPYLVQSETVPGTNINLTYIPYIVKIVLSFKLIRI